MRTILFCMTALWFLFGATPARAQSGQSGTSPGWATIMSEYCESCAFPIKIAGAPIGNAAWAPTASYSGTLCWCDTPWPGLPVGGWVPERLVETVRVAYDSPVYGTNLMGSQATNSKSLLLGGVGSPAGGTAGSGFFNVHVWPYPASALYSGLMSASLTGTDAGGTFYMSEIDPTWANDSLSLIMTPEAALFATMPAQLACAADAIAADTYQPLDYLTWCMGSWGSAYPSDGTSATMDAPKEHAYAVAHTLVMLTRRLQIKKTMGGDAICGSYPEPVFFKSMFRLEQLWPTPELTGDHWIGEDPNLWGEFRYKPYMGEDFVNLVWQWIDACDFSLIKGSNSNATTV